MILMKASARAFASPVRYKNYIIGDESPAAGTHAAPLAMRLRHISWAALSFQATPFARKAETVFHVSAGPNPAT
jgi:hypothetical protein